jgi:hypothetical protein
VAAFQIVTVLEITVAALAVCAATALNAIAQIAATAELNFRAMFVSQRFKWPLR